jgi:outer membrane protein assembly factor BamE (lipoprotein component of BamABCDE complex)
MKAASLTTLVVAAIISAGIAGCSSQGNQQIEHLTPAQVSQKITRGQTTQAQVKACLGDPLKVSFNNSGKQQWEYDFTKLHLTATDFIPFINALETNARGTKKSLVILFNRQGVVQNYSLTCSKIYHHSGIIN